MKTKYLILGAGLAGLSTAYHLCRDYKIIDSADSPGGTAGTLKINGFKLDNAVHVLYFRHEASLNWLQNDLKIELISKSRIASVWLQNSYINFPIQYHLSSLPPLLQFNSFKSILASAFRKQKSSVDNFDEYSKNTLGGYLTDIFVRPYNEKLFGVPISDLTNDWLGDYVPTYSKLKMLLSAFGLVENNHGRNSYFYYPADGGISEIAMKICAELNSTPLYNSTLMKLSLDNKTVKFTDEKEICFKYLINTIPLKHFLQKIDNLPADIADCTELLKYTSTTFLHLLCKGNLVDNANHWIYTPEASIPFYRITLPGNINPRNCPEGYFSITLEFNGNVFDKPSMQESSKQILKRMGLLKNALDIEYHWRLIDCSYVIYDKNRKIILDRIFSFLKSNQVFSIGRYGSWEYSNMEDAMLQGKKVAEELSVYTNE